MFPSLHPLILWVSMKLLESSLVLLWPKFVSGCYKAEITCCARGCCCLRSRAVQVCSCLDGWNLGFKVDLNLERSDRVKLEIGALLQQCTALVGLKGQFPLLVNYTQRWCCGRSRGGGCELRFTSVSDIELNYNVTTSAKMSNLYRVKKIKTSCAQTQRAVDIYDVRYAWFLKSALFQGCIMCCSIWTQGTDCNGWTRAVTACLLGCCSVTGSLGLFDRARWAEHTLQLKTIKLGLITARSWTNSRDHHVAVCLLNQLCS